MSVGDLIRVVAMKGGRLKEVEFRLRPGEKGLSMFRWTNSVGPEDVIDAVRAMGKQGELRAAIIQEATIHELGMVITPTTGGTLSQEVNATHVEVRLRWAERAIVWLRRESVANYFNERLTPRLFRAARLTE